MPEPLSSFAKVIFIDRERVMAELRQAAAAARAAHPGIVRILLFGSLARGDWTGDSDADLIVVTQREFTGILDRVPYQIHVASVPTDTLIYSVTEFERLASQPNSLAADALTYAIEL